MNTQSGSQPAIADAASDTGRYEGVGHSLKVVRERRGLALADVSARLRIRRPYLEAIEEGRFGELPGAVYVSGFLRQYAEFLGLDPDQVLKNYQSESDGAVQRTVLNFPMPRPEERTPRLWLVVGALVLAGIVYALWYRHQEALRIGQDLIQAVPSRLADLVPSPQPIAPASPPIVLPPPVQTAQAPTPPSAPSSPTSLAQAPAAVAPATPASASPASAAPTPAAPAPVVAAPAMPAPASAQAPAPTSAPPAQDAASPPATVAAAPTPKEPPASYGAATAGRIRVEAIAAAWIQVRGPNNEQIFTRLLSAGERYQVPDREGLTLLTGNAGGVRIVGDGQTLAPLGAEGEVKRGIPLDPERLKNPGGERQG
ncbi:MAG: RodZ domain-containing protein [Ferrovibrio sp.]